MRELRVCLAVLLLAPGIARGAGDEPAKTRPAAAGEGDKVVCGTAGADLTFALEFNRSAVGELSGTYLEIGFQEPLDLPGGAAKQEIAGRLTSLLPAEGRLGPRAEVVANRTLYLSLTTTEVGIPPGPVFTVRFDCPAGARIGPGDLSCRLDRPADGAGLAMPESLARQVRCKVIRIDPAIASR